MCVYDTWSVCGFYDTREEQHVSVPSVVLEFVLGPIESVRRHMGTVGCKRNPLRSIGFYTHALGPTRVVPSPIDYTVEW